MKAVMWTDVFQVMSDSGHGQLSLLLFIIYIIVLMGCRIFVSVCETFYLAILMKLNLKKLNLANIYLT